MRLVVFFCLLISTIMAHAEIAAPKGCQSIAIQGEGVTLQAKKYTLVFINNMSETDLWITHPVTGQSESGGWTSRLQAGNWSALAVDQGPFLLNCIESKPGHEQQVPCEKAIGACEMKGVKRPDGAQGKYWAGEDMSLSALTTSLEAKGIKWPKKD